MIKKGLGKGLNALLSIYDEEDNVAETEGTKENRSQNGIEGVDINLIFANPNQPRKNFEEDLESIKGWQTRIKTYYHLLTGVTVT